jgi:hypothetical protein
VDDAGSPQTHFRMGEPLVIVVKVYFSVETSHPIFGVNIETDAGIRVADCRSSHSDLRVGKVFGEVTYQMRIDSIHLYPRTYVVQPWVTDAAGSLTFDWVHNAGTFLVTKNPDFACRGNVDANHGISFIPTSWVLGTPEATVVTELRSHTDMTVDEE